MFINIKLEEQKTTNERLKILLKEASKKGTGKSGFPEFIITFPAMINLVMIIECKPQLKNHTRTTPNEKHDPEKYAVDGVLHYANFLKHEFDVIAIAVSGQDKNKLKISNFILRRQHEQKEIDTKLLSIYDYLTYIENENNVEKLKHENILLTASRLNQKLYEYSVPEQERATIVSGILIALQYKVFRDGYVNHTEPSELLEDLLEAVKRVLRKNEMGDKIPALMNEYYTMRKSAMLAKDKTIRNRETNEEETNTLLRDMIYDIHTKVFPFTTYKNAGYDILGEFYSEFIRYANGDKKLGLVLTPQYIADLFVDIADLQKDDVVYDNCCGTAGFLIKSLKKLIQLAGNDTNKVKQIKSNQIIGFETRSDMFTYACSNMMMRGDGKSNIHQGNSLSSTNTDYVKKLKPTVGMLNPPYSQGIPELEFVYNNLECLREGGKGIAIIPINSILEDSGVNYEWKVKLLDKHTLEAVFSMPVEAFYPIGVVTAIVVFKAHHSHPMDYESYFGYWRDDGFIKTKNLGRIDKNGTWEQIKKNWLYAYRNRKTVEGHSLTKYISSKDEWCVEAYMETDYSKITKEDYLRSVKEYMIYKIRSMEL
jgi:type I restriction-modification system DNA methylase subunit